MEKERPDIERLIRQIEIHTKRMMSGSLMGDSRSAVKGSGFEFDQIREYQIGDDVRHIDWKSSSRVGSLLVKQFMEERSRNVMLAIDVSASMQFGTQSLKKHELASQIAAALALVATYGKDRIGLLLFAEDVEAFIPFGRGLFHARHIIKTIYYHVSQSKKTNSAAALKKLMQIREKNSMLFFISDFIDESLQNRYLPLVASMYDMVAVRCLDPNELAFPNVGFVTVQDIETGELIQIDTRKRGALKQLLEKRCADNDTMFKKYNIDILSLRQQTLVRDVVRFFRKRMSY